MFPSESLWKTTATWSYWVTWSSSCIRYTVACKCSCLLCLPHLHHSEMEFIGHCLISWCRIMQERDRDLGLMGKEMNLQQFCVCAYNNNGLYNMCNVNLTSEKWSTTHSIIMQFFLILITHLFGLKPAEACRSRLRSWQMLPCLL